MVRTRDWSMLASLLGSPASGNYHLGRGLGIGMRLNSGFFRVSGLCSWRASILTKHKHRDCEKQKCLAIME